MKHFRAHIVLFFVAFAALLFVVLFDVSTSGAQSPRNSKPVGPAGNVESKVKPTVLRRERHAEDASERSLTSSHFSAAVTRNAQLRTELSWFFGGKQQRGWYLYSTLIGRLLRTELDPASEGFASALALWQEQTGLGPSGVLDEESLYAMVSKWQETRLKDRTPAPSEKMLVAPVSDFYDPSRIDELRLIERETYAAYKRMVAAAISDRSLSLAARSAGELALEEKYLKIISSFRTRDYQERLRRESPRAGRAGLAVNSPHFTGRALDLYVGGEPVDARDSNRAVQVETPVYKWLVRNAERFGFSPYYYEPWHWEYVK